MNKQQVPPPCVLANIRIAFHDFIPQWTNSHPWPDEGAHQKHDNNIWNQSVQTQTYSSPS